MSYSIKMDEKNDTYAVDGTTGYSINQMNYATMRKVIMTTFYIQCGLQPAYMNFQHYKKLLKVNTEKVIWPVRRSLAGQLLSPVLAASSPCPTAPRCSCSGHTGQGQACVCWGGAMEPALCSQDGHSASWRLKSFIHSLVL